MLNVMERYAWALVGQPYRWGGEGPHFDCSGLVQEILRSVGEDPSGDQTAQTLYDYFKPRERHHRCQLGSLAFYGVDNRSIRHVAFCIDNVRVIEAGGGDSKTTSLEAAIKQGAFVRVRLVDARKDLVAIIRPQYRFEAA